MGRRKRQVTPENHERWLVSYADFITLLLAFFVVMFANSQVDRAKMASVSESVKGALEGGSVNLPVQGFLSRSREVRPDERGAANAPGSRHPLAKPVGNESQMAELLPTVQELTKDLKSEIDQGKLQVELTPRGMVISMREAAFFAAGDDKLSSDTLPILEKLAAVLKRLPNPVRMEGHTDSVPISNSRFRSNWELSAARAIAMMETLVTRFGVERRRVAVAGYADNAPADSNDNATGRAHNRRVDVVILNQLGQSTEPLQAGKLAPASPAN